MAKNNNQIPLPVKIIKKQILDESNILYTFEPVGFKLEKYSPGQFCMISIPGYGESAISYASCYNSSDFFELGVRKVGKLTSALSYMKIGDMVGYRGSFGNGYPMQEMSGKNILIITGGCGIHPFKALVEEIVKHRKNFGHVRMIFGAKNPSSLLYSDKFSEWENHIEVLTTVDATDDKWNGACGIITDLLAKNVTNGKESYGLLCGPPIMFKPSVDILLKSHFNPEHIFISLERKMKCAIGKCQHCVCGGKYVCTDGPVFNYKQILSMPGAI